MKELANFLLDITYYIIGLQFLHTAYVAFKDHTNTRRIGTSLFWSLLGIVFVGGKFIPDYITGFIILLIALLTLFKQVKVGTLPKVDEAKAEKHSQKIGSWIFLPVLILGGLSFLIPLLIKEFGTVSVAIASLVATIVALGITRQSPKALAIENARNIQQISSSSILPQLLGSLGAVFTAAGVGTVISDMISSVVPEGNKFFGVVAYVLGMVIFTMIMGNAFAAFTVITAGVGVPFVFALGANPIVAGAFAMTAGYCGTLLTPMAANFNAVPVALMDIKDKNVVIKAQLPIAVIMIIAHILLMYFLAF